MLTIGAFISLMYIRYRSDKQLDPIFSLTFWLTVIIGAPLYLHLTWILGGKYRSPINKEIIHGSIWGSCMGFAIWATEYFFTSTLLNLIISLASGAMLGILFFIAKAGIKDDSTPES